MEAPPIAKQTNAAGPILNLLGKLSSTSVKRSVAHALADAMPFRPTANPSDNVAKAEVCHRVSAIVHALSELRDLIEVSDVPLDPARAMVGNALAMFIEAPANADSGSGWFHGRISKEMVVAFQFLAHQLPKDRTESDQAHVQELLVALAALRALAVDPRTAPAVAKHLQQIVQMLEEAVIASYLRGPVVIVDVMSRWRRHHEDLGAAVQASGGGENFEAIAATYENLGEKAKAYADNLLRVAGLMELFRNGLTLLGKAATGV